MKKSHWARMWIGLALVVWSSQSAADDVEKAIHENQLVNRDECQPGDRRIEFDLSSQTFIIGTCERIVYQKEKDWLGRTVYTPLKANATVEVSPTEVSDMTTRWIFAYKRTTYGAWCGRGCDADLLDPTVNPSKRCAKGPRASVEVCDELDNHCREHDLCYSMLTNPLEEFTVCDQNLIHGARRIIQKGKKPGDRASDAQVDSAKAVAAAFEKKILLKMSWYRPDSNGSPLCTSQSSFDGRFPLLAPEE